MQIDYKKEMQMVYKFGIEISTVIEIEEVYDRYDIVEYTISEIKIWSDRRKKYVSPSGRLLNYIESELDGYPAFLEDIDAYAEECKQDSLDQKADFQYEMMRDQAMGL